MKKLLSVVLTLALLLMLTACGAASDTVAYKTGAVAAPAMAAEEAAEAEYGLQSNGQGAQAELPENRKWVVTVYLEAETEDLDAMMEQLNAQIREAEGYVENQSVYNGSTRNEYRYRNANLTIRVPADRVDFFVDQLGTFSNVVSQEQNKEDITLTYVATQSRMTALETEQARLLELLAQAETMEDLLTIEARLTDVRTELESVTTQMRIYDNQVDYATLHLGIREVKEYTPVEEPGIWQRITEGFRDSLEGLTEGTVDVLVWLLASSPYLVTYGALLLLAIWLGKKLSRGKKREKKPFRFGKGKKNSLPAEFPREGSSEEETA